MHRSPSDKGWPEDQVTEFIDQLSSAGGDYRRLVERLPAIIYTAELGEHGRWRYVSPQVEEILGYSQEEWTGDPGLWAELLHPDDRERALEQETRKTLGERNPPPVDYRMVTRGGDVVWILDEAVLEPDDVRNAGLARGPLRHHRAQARRAGAAAGGGPAGDGGEARRAGARRTATPSR